MPNKTNSWQKEDMVKTYGEEAAEILIGFKSRIDDLNAKIPDFLKTSEAKTLMEAFQAEFGKKLDEQSKAQNEEIQKLKAQNEELKNVVVRTKSTGSQSTPEQTNEKMVDVFSKTLMNGLASRAGVAFDALEKEMLAVEKSDWEFYKDNFGRRYTKAMIEEEVKVMSTLNFANAGAIMMPPTMWNGLIDLASREITNLAQYCMQLRIATEAIEMGTIDGHGNYAWTGEEKEATESEPKFGNKKTELHGLAVFYALTQKQLQYSGMDIMELMMNDFKEALAEATGSAQVNGTGVQQPLGIMNTPGIASRKQGEAGNITDFDAIRQMQFDLKETYYGNLVWVMSRLTRGTLEIIKDENKRYYLGQEMKDQPQDRLLGKKIVFAQEMPAIADGAFPILLGNFRKGALSLNSRRAGINITDPFSMAKKGMIVVTLMNEYGFRVLKEEAFIKLETSA